MRSRQVISSGGVEPVTDGGADGHSLFAFYLINALRKNDREVIDLENLFHTQVWKPVTEIGDQRPNVGRLKTPMDQDGQFVLHNAAWAREQQARRAAVEAEKQRQAQARQKASVAAAELELQRQRFEMEKEKLALEREQLAQQKALEMERLKIERQKQEIEYARLQQYLKDLMRENGFDPERELNIYHSICGQVSSRESKMREFAAGFDLVFFVSGKNSSNGKVLFKACKEVNENTHFISRPEESDTVSLKDVTSIGICGATSSPLWLLSAVKDRLTVRLNIAK